MTNRFRTSAAVAALMALSACGVFKGGQKRTPTVGDRVPILVSENDVEADPAHDFSPNYVDTRAWFDRLDQASDLIRIEQFGVSPEGRPIYAVIAGREAYLAGRMAKRLYADPSSPDRKSVV